MEFTENLRQSRGGRNSPETIVDRKDFSLPQISNTNFAPGITERSVMGPNGSKYCGAVVIKRFMQ